MPNLTVLTVPALPFAFIRSVELFNTPVVFIVRIFALLVLASVITILSPPFPPLPRLTVIVFPPFIEFERAILLLGTTGPDMPPAPP